MNRNNFGSLLAPFLGLIVVVGLLYLLICGFRETTAFGEKLQIIQLALAFFGPVIAYFFASQATSATLDRQATQLTELSREKSKLQSEGSKLVDAIQQVEGVGGGRQNLEAAITNFKNLL